MNSCLRKEKENGVVLEGNFLSQSNANSWKIIWAICEQMIAFTLKWFHAFQSWCPALQVTGAAAHILWFECTFISCWSWSVSFVAQVPTCGCQIGQHNVRDICQGVSVAVPTLRSRIFVGPLLRRNLLFTKARCSERLAALHTSWLYNKMHMPGCEWLLGTQTAEQLQCSHTYKERRSQVMRHILAWCAFTELMEYGTLALVLTHAKGQW